MQNQNNILDIYIYIYNRSIAIIGTMDRLAVTKEIFVSVLQWLIRKKHKCLFVTTEFTITPHSRLDSRGKKM